MPTVPETSKRGVDEISEGPSHLEEKRKQPRLGDEPRTIETTTGSADDLPIPGSSSSSRTKIEHPETEMDVDTHFPDADNEQSKGQGGRKGHTGKQKEKKKTRREPRSRAGFRSRNEEDAEKPPMLDVEGNPIPKPLRYPKRQCALLLGFCGSGYSGMQIQPEHSQTKTIEGVLFDALVKVGAVSEDNSDNATKVNLARAARTDAGVHAAGNVVSLKMILTIRGVDDIVARINEELPPEIRIWGLCRTQNSFNARLICESRKYTYFFPSYMLVPPKPGSGIHRVWTQNGGESDSNPVYSFWKNHDSATVEEDLARKRAWRIGSEQMQALRDFSTRFEGTHNFHNFTVGRDQKDRSNMRYMKKIEVADPVVYGGTEWISVLFHGQSFMLHQIRKMMSMLVLGPRMGTPIRVLSEMFGKRSVFVPKMPALGLLLEEPLYESYNSRVAAINEKLQPTDNEYRPSIDFDLYREQIEDFKAKFIYKNMREVEDRDGIFDAWLRAVDSYCGNDLLYLNSTGAVPDAAVITKGVRRDAPFREKRIFDTTSFTPDSDSKNRLKEDIESDSEDEAVLNKRNLEEMEG